MKLNFLEILSGAAHSAEDIAREIVSLEGKAGELKTEAKKYHDLSKDLRAKRMCGDAVNARDIERLREKISEIEDDIALCNETRQSLEGRLKERIKSDKEMELVEIETALEALWSQERSYLIENAKLRGRVEAMKHLVSEKAAGSFEPHEAHQIIANERDRILREAERPSLADKDKELRRRQFILKSMNLQAEFTTLLEKLRRNQSEES